MLAMIILFITAVLKIRKNIEIYLIKKIIKLKILSLTS